jgi:hypothetical protein
MATLAEHYGAPPGPDAEGLNQLFRPLPR